MRFEMKMPDLATTESEIRIVRWLVELGQTVQRGQPLLEVETDKATMEVESVAGGVLQEVRSPANDLVAVGQVIAVLEVGATAPTAAPDGVPLLRGSSAGCNSLGSTTSEQAVAHGGEKSGSVLQAAPLAAVGGAVGMFARNRAAAASNATCGAGVPPACEATMPACEATTPALAAGTAAPQLLGQPLRIGEETIGVGQVANLPQSGQNHGRLATCPTQGPTVIDSQVLTVAQRVAAKRLQESKQTIPHFYLQTSVNVSGVIARRKAAEPVQLAWDAFAVLAIARAIAKFDRFRCRFDTERLTPIDTDAIGVAVDQDDELYVVSIATPAAKTVEQISADIRHGVERLRSGDPEVRRIRPALMTVTNLGVCNIECFLPIINPPEAAILGIGRVVPTPVVLQNGEIAAQPRCTLTLSVDHRVASGRYAGRFLGEIVRELELF